MATGQGQLTHQRYRDMSYASSFHAFQECLVNNCATVLAYVVKQGHHLPILLLVCKEGPIIDGISLHGVGGLVHSWQKEHQWENSSANCNTD